MLKIAICDDSTLFPEHAEELVRKWSDESCFPVQIFTYTNGDDLIAATTSDRMDIIFLDIIMPLFNGMDTARELRKHDKTLPIIFLTSSPEFALESYEVRASGYLLKPVAYEKIKDALDECARSFHEEPEHFILKTSFGYQKLYFHDIEYAEAQNKKVLFHLRSGRLNPRSRFILLKRSLQTETVFSNVTVVILSICRMLITSVHLRSSQSPDNVFRFPEVIQRLSKKPILPGCSRIPDNNRTNNYNYIL